MLLALLAAGNVFLGTSVGVGAATGTPSDAPGGIGHLALSLDVTVEAGRLFCAGSMQHAGFGTGEASLLSARAGYLLREGDWSPYLAVGPGLLSETLYSNFDCVSADRRSCYTYDGNGLALILEGGVIFAARTKSGSVTPALVLRQVF